ncbi:MAG: NAD-dependent epimerase/dehydratase family protein [Shimia sp.]|nr:NAD-dependent epimerase/dehydratase family protein [Shimia sp.]
MKTALVLGAGGFIGGHLVKRLQSDGYWVRGVDLKHHDFDGCPADDFILGDLRQIDVVDRAMDRTFDDIYQLAADMGGAGYLFTGEHDADVMHNSAQINLNVADVARRTGHQNLFYSSSACIYPKENQTDPQNPNCEESSAYPADPDSEYGWEKLFSERLYASYNRNYGLNVKTARFHNVFGPLGTYQGGREKAPAAISRKVAEAPNGGTVEVWGSGDQTRSFLYVDEAVEAVLRLMRSDFAGPVNIGSDEMVSINDLARMAIDISGKDLTIHNVDGPEGVRGRNSDNALIQETLGWAPSQPLRLGMEKTYAWVSDQVAATQA